MTGSAFVSVPRAAGPNPFKVVRRSPYSCRGAEPYGVQKSTHVLPASGVSVQVAILAWSEDPRGHCGECPACAAVRWPNGVWAATHAAD